MGDRRCFSLRQNNSGRVLLIVLVRWEQAASANDSWLAGEEEKRTCATRPFQISAFFLSPQGLCPSLKFHFLSFSTDVVVVAC